MIDLSRMRSVRVDPVRCTARAEGGVTWGEFNHETQAFGLATTGGTVSDTGIAGLSLGGGLGWLAGKHGLVCDNLLAVDLVTADGQFLTASAAEHADLFWGVRGGGGNFGVVTAFEYQLHPVGPCLAGTVIYPFEQAKAVLHLYRDVTRASPDALNTMGELFTLPDGLPAVGIHVCYSGPRDAGEVVLRPLRTFRPLLMDLIRPMAYTEVNTMFDAQVPPGRRNYVKTLLVREITDDAIDTLIAHFATVPSPLTIADFMQVGNAARRVGAEATPFCHRDAQYEFFIHAIWLDPAEDEAHIRWTRALFEQPPFQTGCSYINHMGREVEEGAERIRAAFGPNYERLVALKNQYDPTNLFRHNQNILPTG
jgi:FAD/FMN-containing dehydrogenase